jgi:hypothetical protein
METQIAWEPFVSPADQNNTTNDKHPSSGNLRERLTQKMERMMIDMELFENDPEFQQVLRLTKKTK